MKFLLRVCAILCVVGSLVSCTPNMPSPGGIVVAQPGASQQLIMPGQ